MFRRISCNSHYRERLDGPFVAGYDECADRN